MGNNASFNCSSKDKLNWQWFFNNGPLLLNAYLINQAASKTSFLKLRKVKEVNAGSYTCRGLDEDGNIEYEAEGELAVLKGKFMFCIRT